MEIDESVNDIGSAAMESLRLPATFDEAIGDTDCVSFLRTDANMNDNVVTCQETLDSLRRLVNQHDEHLEDALPEVERLLSRFVASRRCQAAEMWPKSRGRYTRVMLNSESAPFQFVLVFWPPGARSAIHSHDETIGGVMPLYGELKETRYGVTCQSADRAVLRTLRIERMRNFSLSPILPTDDDQVHDMLNDSFEWAASLHVYLRKVERFRLYANCVPEVGDYAVETVPFWVDYHDGVTVWDTAPDIIPTPPPRAEEHLGDVSIQASCLCGACRLSATCAPCLELVCHCRDCQKATGCSSAEFAFFDRSHVQVHGDAVETYRYQNGAGSTVSRTFCKQCGGRLFQSTTSSPHLVGVHVGAIDELASFRPSTSIFIGSAPAWSDLHRE